MSIIIGSTIFNGRNVTISNNRVIIDGVDITDKLPDQKTINIEVHGNIDSIKADICQQIKVNGDVGSVQSQSGDIECGDVKGSISTMSGDVDCGNVGGGISTMTGDIKHKKS